MSSITSNKSTNISKITSVASVASTISTKVSSNSNRQHRTLENDPLIGMTIEVNPDNTDNSSLKSVGFSDTHNTTREYQINIEEINQLLAKLTIKNNLIEKLSNKIDNGKGNNKDKKNLEMGRKNMNNYIAEIQKLSDIKLKSVKEKITSKEKQKERKEKGQEKIAFVAAGASETSVSIARTEATILELELKSDGLSNTSSDNKSLASSGRSTISTVSRWSESLDSNSNSNVNSVSLLRRSLRRQDSDTDLQQALLNDIQEQDGDKKPRAKK